MISIDEHPPPDPSSSDYQNQQQQQVSHEALATVSDIDLLKPKDATLVNSNNPHPNFSIRDYVYGSRCKKNIARNWPFSHKSLQLCLNYCVNYNFLPPFESLDSLRSNQSVSTFAVENHFPDEEIVTNFNSKPTDDRFISLTSSCVKSQSHLEEDLAPTKSNSQPTVKKCKLVMKSNSGTDPVEETVASKVCPVCKTFSSSSNTTLNAHIDQCLSEESSMKSTANPKIKTVKQHRIKPRKTRLMVDIYKTAPHCTVEELDRRNGTSWATNSNFPDQEFEFQAEEKKEVPTFIPKVADPEGAVYIDTNGTKVRILSINKLDDDNGQKLQREEKGSKFVKGKKKMKANGQKTRQKILKLSPSSKKLSKKAVDYKHATSGQKENVATLGSHKKDRGENPMKAQANKQMDNNIVTITRPSWACSKRTGVAKKRFPVLTNPKERTRLFDNSEDPSIIISSKGCNKFSSLKKNVLVSESQEHNASGSKFNLKRKFSALKKPQDSWKQNSRMEKDPGVKKKKSIASKKSNGDGGDSSSGGVENITTESARIEVPFHSDLVGIDQGNNFMGLRNSLDDEFDPREGTLDDILMGHNTEKEENYFEVDPLILNIPGPPGSFLPPSPGVDDMVISEEEQLQANSSLTTTSRLHSNEDQLSIHHDLMKTDFISDSLVSTVTSPSFARSCDKLSSRFTSQQHKKSVNSSDMLGSVDASFTEKNPTPCCSGKEHQESPLELINRGPKCIDFMPNLFSLRLQPPETVKSAVDASVKLPVLRLMGKNLTVVKTDDDDDDDGSVKPPMGQYPPPHHQVIFSHNQNGSMHQSFNLHPPNNSRSFDDLCSANKEIIIIDDSSENEVDACRMFKESLIRNRASSSSSLSFANPYSINGSFDDQTSSHLREVVMNDGNFGISTDQTRYPLSSISSMSSSTAAFYRSSS